MENKEWKSHKSWSEDLLAGGPLKLVQQIVKDAGVNKLTIPELKGKMQAKTQSEKVYNTIALKKYLEHFPQVIEIDAEDKLLHAEHKLAARQQKEQEEAEERRHYVPGVEPGAVQQWKKEGTGIWARRDCSKVQLKTYLILRDMEMRRVPNLQQTVRSLHTEMIKDMIEQIDTDPCLLASQPEEITYSQWQLAEDTKAATFLKSMLQTELDIRQPPRTRRSPSPRRDSRHDRRRSPSRDRRRRSRSRDRDRDRRRSRSRDRRRR
jgi:hypothetical protein